MTITAPCNLVVDFSWSTSTTVPLTINFQNLSVPLSATDSITWNFGDGTSSHDVNAMHTYATAGTYNVCLIVKKNTNTTAAPCIKYICKTIIVQQSCNLVVDFSSTATATNPLRIEFTNLSTPLSNSDSIRWTFGDGHSSNQVNPVHIYNAPGIYTVCLRIIKYNGSVAHCIREICKTVVVTNPNTCNMVPNFTWTASAANPLRIEFHNTSTNTALTDSIRWTFGDGSTSNEMNPVHTYNVAGTYTVCLRIIRHIPGTTAPCIKEICKTIVVMHPCNLVINFTSQPNPNNPLQVTFTNTSTPINASDSVRWTFGDGTSVTGLQSDPNVANPTHNYTSAGNYVVCLRIKKNNNTTPIACVMHKCETIVVHAPCNLVVNFTSQPNPNNPLQVTYTNTSTPSHATDSLKWTFGDGTSLSGVQGDPNVANPTHNYANTGTYTVCLIVKKNINTTPVACIRDKCAPIVVHAPCSLIVNFTSQAAPNNPLQVKFTNTSTPINASDSVRWTFGDGTSISGLQSDPNVANPTHNYTSAGNYVVCLRIKKNNNTTPVACEMHKCETIVVTHPCNFNVNFSWRLDSANNRKVYFTNLTATPTATAIAVWNFGDGTTATSWDAIHEYAQPGTYIVCLRIYLGGNSNCVREKCDTIFIPHAMPPCTQLSKFRYERFSNDNQKYKFTPDYINTALHYTWTFGDGTGSQDPIAIHRYAQPGTYTACLTVWRGPNCASTTCHQINVQPQIICDTSHVSYTYQRDPQVPNKIRFFANGTLPILDQTWTLTRLNSTVVTTPVILHQNNPIYLFQDTGYYRVCLRAIMMGGCIKEYCSIIRIEQVSNACTLQAFPNPASTMVNVNVFLTQPDMIHAYVYSSQNVLVLDKHQQGFTGNNLVSLNVSNLAAGHYTIRMVYGNHVCYANFQKL